MLQPKAIIARNTLLILTLVLASCAAPAAPGAPAGQAPASAGKAAITLAWPFSDWPPEFDEGIRKPLNDDSATYEINLNRPTDDYWGKLLVLIAANEVDLMWVNPSHLATFVDQGYLMDLGSCLEEHGELPAAKTGDYAPFTLAAYTINDQSYGLPLSVEPLMLYVNRDDAYGAGFMDDQINNWSWDELQAASQEIRDKSDKEYGFVGYGGALSPDSQSQWRVLIKNGQASIVIDWAGDDYEQSEYPGKNDGIRAYWLPQTSDGVRAIPFRVGGAIGIYARTEHPDEACQAMLYLTQKLQELHPFPARMPLFTVDQMIKHLPYKADTSAVNIVESLQCVAGGTCSMSVWVPYDGVPGPDVIGEAELAPGAPVMIDAVAQLRDILVEDGVQVNVARTVRLGSATTYAAPCGKLPFKDRNAFVKQAQEKGVNLCTVVLDSQNDLSKPPGPYALRIHLSTQGKDDVKSWTGTVDYIPKAKQGAFTTSILKIEEDTYCTDGYPCSAISSGSKVCRKCTSWPVRLCFTVRC